MKKNLVVSFIGSILIASASIFLIANCRSTVDPLGPSGQIGKAPLDTTAGVGKLQVDYIAMKFGMFIHYSMSTYSRANCDTCVSPKGEWEKGNKRGEEPDSLFNPGKLDCKQWAHVAKSAHAKYVVLTTKHHGGFALWPTKSQTIPHNIAMSPWYAKNGNRDVVAEFVKAVRDSGMEPGFYFSVWDRTNEASVPMIKAQLTELLSNYGDIKCIWFDGWGWQIGYEAIPYDSIANLVHELNRKLDHHTIIIEQNHRYKIYKTELVEYEMPIDNAPLSNNALPAEGNDPLRLDNCWFWHSKGNCDLKQTTAILTNIKNCNNANANYMVDVTPDTSGLIPDCQVQRMKEIGDQAVLQGILQ